MTSFGLPMTLDLPAARAAADAVIRDPARQAALRAMCLNGLPAGPVLDRMTRLAARLLRAPVALGTLVDFDRQVLASAYDPEERYVKGAEASIEYSFCQYAVADGDSFTVDDTREHPLVADSPAVTENHVLAYAGIPLVVGGQPLGALCVLDYVPRNWNKEEIEILRDLAAAAATELELRNALEEAHGRAEAETSLQRLKAVQSVTDVALHDRPLDVLFSDLLERIRDSFEADTATLLLLSEDRNDLVVRASLGTGDAGIEVRVPVGQGIAGRVAQTGEPTIVTDVTAATIVNPSLRTEVGSLLAVPLFIEGQVYGVMHVGSRSRREFNSDDVRLMELVAERAATAIERARLHESERHARLAAEAGNRSKAEFLSVMSHELRTPLNAIGGYSQLLIEGVRGEISEPQKEYVSRILSSQQHLLAMIDSILRFADLDAGRERFLVTTVDLDIVVHELEKSIQRDRKKKRLRFDVDCPPGLRVRGNQDRIDQILEALVSNAIKFAPAGGRISLDCATDGAVARISVSDNGAGIPADRIALIFSKFVQADQSTTRRHDGLGLGLAMSRALARSMGGDIEAHSEPGEGATFTLTLPVSPEDSPPL